MSSEQRVAIVTGASQGIGLTIKAVGLVQRQLEVLQQALTAPAAPRPKPIHARP